MNKLKKCIIAEKPSLGRNIASAINEEFRKGDGFLESEGYIVTWAFGHLFGLINLEEYDKNYNKDEKVFWRLDNLPFCPDKFRFKLKEDQGVEKQFNTIKTLVFREDVDGVVNAGDSDREGEIIVRLILAHLGNSKPTYRLWLPDQTSETIREAITLLPDDKNYDNLAFEGYARTFMDWLYGINLTRYASVRSGKLLRVGRVVTPIVSEIYNREMEIRNFVPKDYFKVKSNCDGLEMQSSRKFDTKEEADEYAQKLNEAKSVVTEVDDHSSTVSPGKLYSLSKLQGVLGKKFKMSPKVSLETVQSLYEKGFVTYPRTNTEYLATAEKDKISNVLKKLPQQDLDVSASEKIFDDGKIESHSALTPTINLPGDRDLTDLEKKVYDTIMARFLAVFCNEKCIVDKTEITVDIGGIETIKVKGQVIKQKGWTKYDDYSTKDKTLPDLAKGQEINTEFISEKDTTKAPDRYTTDSFYKYLKNPFKKDEIEDEEEEYKAIFSGVELGTEATRTGIIEGAVKSKYIDLKDNKFYLLPDGEAYIDYLNKLKLLLDKRKTADMGIVLKDVFKGKNTINQAIKYTYDEIRGLIEQSSKIYVAKTIKSQSGDGKANIKAAKTEYVCPCCKKGTVLETKFGYLCSEKENSGCGFSMPKTLAGHTFTSEETKELMTKGEIFNIEDFVSKAGKPFSAGLYFKKDGALTFDFHT